ncbi:MAG: ABC transporter permease [Rhodospirillales bacterium]|nr:ABC transporter permease [Rhodospirillales bacterium]
MNGFGLAVRLARRELRGGLKSGFRGFRIFIACLALGVAAIAGVGSISESVVAGLRADARTLLGGDVELRLQHRAADAEQLVWLRDHSVRQSSTVRMRAMARPVGSADGRALVELKAVDAAYPLVGALMADPQIAQSELLARRDGVWGVAVDANLLTKLGIARGAHVRIGEAEFEVRAVITREPDRVASVIAFGPRAMIAAAALEDTRLIQPGSQIRYYYRLALAPGTDVAAWIENVKTAFPQAGWRIRGVDDAAPGIRRFIERLTLFLTFVGLSTLLVGGIGVGNATKSYLDGKTATIATFKCLGAPGHLVFAVYMLQIMGLAVLGIIAGLVFGAAAPALAMEALSGLLPVQPRGGIFAGPLLVAAAFGVLTAATFALWPLARALDVPAANLFRAFIAPLEGRPRASYIIVVFIGAALLAALTVGTAADVRAALWFVGGATATFAVLRLAASAVMRLAARAPRPRGAEWRLALANLHRPGTSTPSTVVSLGLGLAVLVAVVLIEGNLTRQVDERLPKEAPALFFIDVQPHQTAVFDEMVTGTQGASNYRRVPSLRGRIIRIAGTVVEDAEIAPESRWAVRGDRALTYAATPTKESKIIAGKWWAADYSGPPIISLDAGLARGFGVGLGDKLAFNILGREIEAEIVSLREIDWRSLRFDFAVIFAPGSLEGAPHTHIAAVHGSPETEAMIEKAVTDKFSNVSSIRVREALEAVSNILAGIGVAVRATASVTVLAGGLVLAGAVAAARRRRIYDAIVFKVLGATRTRILAAFLLEYGLLGLCTGLIAAAVGAITAWAVMVFLMQSEFVFFPVAVGLTVVACLAATLAVGFTGTWRALGQKAAPHLRNE